MKPCSRKALCSSNLLQDISLNSKSTVSSIQGSIKKLGEKYNNCFIVLYNKANLQPVAIRKPDKNGAYKIYGLNNSIICFIVAFDSARQFNAVIQDRVIPK